MKVAVIGGGAAGFFSAINAKENFPEAEVSILEKSQKILAKVKISGGGRCNVTNSATSIKELCAGYPRGTKAMKKLLPIFGTTDTVTWFESRGVALYAQDDTRVFPKSDNSQSVIDLLLSECERLGVAIKMGCDVKNISPIDTGFDLQIKGDQVMHFDKVIVASGGSPKTDGLQWLADLGHEIEPSVPSLFTFNMPSEKVKAMMGLSVEPALIHVQGTKLNSIGPLLITHWGMSGPAVLKLSSFGARDLADLSYDFKIQVNWTGVQNHDEVHDDLISLSESFGGKMIANLRPFALPERLWIYLLQRADIESDKPFRELGRKSRNKLVNALTNDIYAVKGKTTFKEEFVTCGGVSWNSVNPKTMESRVVPGLYFSGEILDVDGVTGGFNFQAAWTTGFVAGKLMQ